MLQDNVVAELVSHTLPLLSSNLTDSCVFVHLIRLISGHFE